MMPGAFSPRAAARDFFNPPVAPRTVYRLIKQGLLQSHAVNRRFSASFTESLSFGVNLGRGK